MKQASSQPQQPISLVDQERLTWMETRRLMRSDFERLAEWYGGGSFLHRMGWFIQPNYQCLFYYRMYRYLFLKGWRNAARLMSIYSTYWTGVEISPRTSIGPACLIAHAFGVILFGKLGARLSVFGQGGTGGGMGVEDIGGGPGYPVVGDDVVFGIKSLALGPIRIGNRVRFGPMAFIKRDVPDDALVVATTAKVVRARSGTVGDTPSAEDT